MYQNAARAGNNRPRREAAFLDRNGHKVTTVATVAVMTRIHETPPRPPKQPGKDDLQACTPKRAASQMMMVLLAAMIWEEGGGPPDLQPLTFTPPLLQEHGRISLISLSCGGGRLAASLAQVVVSRPTQPGLRGPIRPQHAIVGFRSNAGMPALCCHVDFVGVVVEV